MKHSGRGRPAFFQVARYYCSAFYAYTEIFIFLYRAVQVYDPRHVL